ncbi:MAG: citrate synthase, partial [Steroidobacteraceae bacterium]
MSWLTARDALDILGVRPQTLYANVSRRRIRARSDPKDPRRSLYLEADVRKLARAHKGARKVERVAAGTIEWGDPILPSGLSTVARGRLWYRGRDAVKLAEQQTLEEVACLLWDAAAGSLGAFVLRPATRGRRRERVSRRAAWACSSREGVSRVGAAESVLRSLFAVVADRAGTDPPSYGRALPVLRGEAADLLETLAASVVGSGTAPLHERLASAWG